MIKEVNTMAQASIEQPLLYEMTRAEALTLALKLAVQAPTQAKSDAVLAEARCIAAAMSEHDVDICKKAAEAAIEYERQYGAQG
jgi:hypothetical protein